MIGAIERPFSYSQLTTYLRCQKMHHYSYVLGIEKVMPSRPLQIGTLVDAGLTSALVGREEGKACHEESSIAINEKYLAWESSTGVAELLDSNPDNVLEHETTRGDSISIASRVIDELELDTGKWTTLRDNDGRLGVQYEVRHSLDAHRPGFIGFIDWLARDHMGSHWQIDFKCRSRFDDAESLGYDYQLPGYMHASYGSFSNTFTGVGGDQIKSKRSTVTELKSGGLSKSKSQSCDWPTYSKAVEERGLDWSKYAEMENKLPKMQDFKWTMKTPSELSRVWEDIEHGARLLVAAHSPGHRPVRNFDPKKCVWCDYKELCVGELKDWDVDHIRLTQFRRKVRD